MASLSIFHLSFSTHSQHSFSLCRVFSSLSSLFCAPSQMLALTRSFVVADLISHIAKICLLRDKVVAFQVCARFRRGSLVHKSYFRTSTQAC
jgi:hypothetical protein